MDRVSNGCIAAESRGHKLGRLASLGTGSWRFHSFDGFLVYVELTQELIKQDVSSEVLPAQSV